MKFVVGSLKQHWGLFLGSSAASAGAAIGTAKVINLTNVLVESPTRGVIPAFVGLVAFMTVMAFTSELLTAWLAEIVACRTRESMCAQILDIPLALLEALGPSRMFAAFADDTMALASSLVLLGGLFVQTVTVLSLLVYVATLSWKLLVVSLSSLVLSMTVVLVIRALSARHYETSRLALDRAFAGVRLLATGMKELKLDPRRRAAFLDQELIPSFEHLRSTSVRGDAAALLAGPGVRLILYATIVFVLVLGHSLHLSSGAVGAYPLAVIATVSPIDQILGALPVLSKGEVAAAALERLGIRLHEKAAEPVIDLEPSPQDTSWEGLSLKDVVYEYRTAAGAPVAIGPVRFTVRPGQITFLVGGNGSGKTTIGKVLTGLYEVHSGSIQLAGRDLEAGNLDWYRSHFAAVFVDFTVFPRPKGVKRSPVAQQKARYYLRALQLTNNMTLAGVGLADLPLSQAQRRRLALFTALLEDRPIYVFDEWAADQDPKFKELFYRHFLPALKASGKAIVAVTHDDKYFDCADQVVEMHEGRQVGGGAGPRVKLAHSIMPPPV